jgi:hypothetical protein
MTVTRLMKLPSAFIPPLMSLAALAIVLLHIARFGAAPEPDEGAAAHLWQLLMLAQLPVIGYFAIRWLNRSAKDAIAVPAIQLAAIVAAATPVFVFKL